MIKRFSSGIGVGSSRDAFSVTIPLSLWASVDIDDRVLSENVT